jgi:hypothetical protein
MSHYQAAVYRQRAAHLRTLATKIENTPSMSLHLHAGVDTWYGPRPDACATDLAIAQHAAREAVDDLRTQAFTFDRRADELEAAAIRAEREAELEAERDAEAARTSL